MVPKLPARKLLKNLPLRITKYKSFFFAFACLFFCSSVFAVLQVRNPGPKKLSNLAWGRTTRQVSELGLETPLCRPQGMSISVARQHGLPGQVARALSAEPPRPLLVTCARLLQHRSGQDGPLRGPSAFRSFLPRPLEALPVGLSRKPSLSPGKPTSLRLRWDPPRPEQVPGLSLETELVCPFYLLPCDRSLPGNPAVTPSIHLS